jgi:hypothetical protein
VRIEAVENRRIRKVHITRIEPPTEDETAETEAQRDSDKRRATGSHHRVTDKVETETQPKPAQSG